MGKSSTNQATENIRAQLLAIKSRIKCEISNVDQKLNLYMRFSVKETEKSNVILQKMLLLCKMN